MKSKEKQMILFLIIIGIVVVSIIYFVTKPSKEDLKIGENNRENKVVEEFVQILDDGTKLNTSTKLQETKKLEGLEISNIQLTHKNGNSVVLADVINKSSNASKLMSVTLTLFDKNGNKIEEIDGLISPLQPGASTQLNMGIQADYANAYDFTIVKR